MPAGPKRSAARPQMTPLSAALSSSKNSLRLTRNKKGDVKIRFTGPVAKFAAFAAVFDLTPLVFPEATPWFAVGLGAATALALLWLAWTLLKGKRLDHDPDRNHFEAGQRATGLRWVAARGAAAWVAAAGLALGLFLLLYPLERIWLGVSFLVVLSAGACLLGWHHFGRARRLPID